MISESLFPLFYSTSTTNRAKDTYSKTLPPRTSPLTTRLAIHERTIDKAQLARTDKAELARAEEAATATATATAPRPLADRKPVWWPCDSCRNAKACAAAPE